MKSYPVIIILSGKYLEDGMTDVSVVNNHGDRFRPLTGGLAASQF